VIDLVNRLRRAYERELDLYCEVERLGRDGVLVVREGRSLAELNEINREKQRHLSAIAEIEMGIAGDKDAWRSAHDGRVLSNELDSLLDRLRFRIETILDLERETERGVVQASGILESKVATS
jgi:hypothetical protein